MLRIECSGSPYEIGLKHGTEARAAIARTLTFYTALFQKNAKLEWPQVQQLAEQFQPTIQKNWPAYLEEMKGIATGAHQPLTSILALNVRTEIVFGLFAPPDACTSLAWQTARAAFLAQNWDWQAAQKRNLVHLLLQPANSPRIQTLTEAGLLAKIGLNSAGVGVCLNAIKASGMDPARMPCHLALRRVLESGSAEEAVAALTRVGVASACHILVADASTGGVGLEFSAKGWRKVLPSSSAGLLGKNAGSGESVSAAGLSSQPQSTGSRNGVVVAEAGDAKAATENGNGSAVVHAGRGRVVHSNHYLVQPDEGVVEDLSWLPDTGFRVGRMEELCTALEQERGNGEVAEQVQLKDIQKLFCDEANFPGSICRAQKAADNEADAVVTVFNIVMDLKVPCARVVIGRPVEPEESFEMVF